MKILLDKPIMPVNPSEIRVKYLLTCVFFLFQVKKYIETFIINGIFEEIYGRDGGIH